MIESIFIKNKGSYDKEGAILEELKDINFIYGANGCGKTTISNLLYDNDTLVDKYSDSIINWKTNTPLKTLIYNKKFRDENFGTGNIAGVFTLGKATKKEIEEIENNNNKLNELKKETVQKDETIKKQNEKLKKLQENLENECWKIYKKYETNFKEAFRGDIGSKKRFKNKLLSMYKSYSEEVLTLSDLTKQSELLLGEMPQSLKEISLGIFLDICDLESAEIWNKNIVGKLDLDISGLINELKNNDWVNQGQKYLVEGGTKCPFCQSETITGNFKKQLEEYFDKSFESDVDEIYELSKSYEEKTEKFLNLIDNIIENQNKTGDSKVDCELLNLHRTVIKSNFFENREHMKKKKDHVSQKVKLSSTKNELEEIYLLIEIANKEIFKHNQIIRNYTVEKEKLVENIWNYLINENLKIIVDYNKEVAGLNKGIKVLSGVVINLKNKIRNLSSEIIELNKNVTSIQPTIDEINNLLKKYGFNNFRLAPSKELKNHYEIQREDKSLAHFTLSEGEVTLITFLYFLQLCKGGEKEDSVSEDRILIIDDPISSLDSNVLFLVSTLIKEIIKDIKGEVGSVKQLILLTHNVYFHKEVSFIDGRNFNNNKTHYWIIRKVDKISKITSYGQKNPIKSSYELLWNEIKEWEKNSGITVQNTMRRIIENYFKILGNFGDDDLINKFKTIEEKSICRSLLCWINDGSHCLPDDLFIQVPDDLTHKYIEVFKNIFKLTNNEGHYNMMMGINFK